MWTKYYHKDKEMIQEKKLWRATEIAPKKKKAENINMAANYIEVVL